jgi:nicotinamidase-related amidase
MMKGMLLEALSRDDDRIAQVGRIARDGAGVPARSKEVRRHSMCSLDPARTALLVVHTAKGVAGQVDTPFNRLFRQRAEKTGVIGVQARLLDAFRGAKAIYTLVTYQPGLPGVRPNSPLFRTLIESPTLLEGTPAVEVIDDVAPRPDEPVVRGQAASGFDGTALDTILRVAG